MNKKILYISPNGYLGGAEKFVYMAVKAHVQRGEKAEVLFFNDGQLVDLCRKESIPHSVLKTKFKLSQLGDLFKAIRELRNFILNKNFDIVHSTMPYAHIVTSLALIGTKIKRVWFQHGPVGGTLDKVANLFGVDLIFFNSNFLRDQHNQMLFSFRHRDRQRIINLGIEKVEVSSSRVDEIRNTFLGPFKELWILPGRITRWKGQHLLIEAIRELIKKDRFKDFAKILIIGEAKRDVDLAYERELKEVVRQNDMEKIFEFVGHRPDIQNFFAASDLTFHCSTLPEPFGLVAAEAMLSGSFVIGSSSGGISDILKDGKTGLSYNSLAPKAKEELEIAIERYREGRIDSNACKKEACALIENEYSVAQMIESLNVSYESLF